MAPMRIIPSLLVLCLASPVAWADSVCAAKAVDHNGKPLQGAAKASSIDKCSRAICEPQAVDHNGKPLYGAAKESAIRKCQAQQ